MRQPRSSGLHARSVPRRMCLGAKPFHEVETSGKEWLHYEGSLRSCPLDHFRTCGARSIAQEEQGGVIGPSLARVAMLDFLCKLGQDRVGAFFSA